MNLHSILPQATEIVSNLQLWGAFCFGAIIGWYVYYINRYRKSDVQFTDLVTVIGIIGGGAVLALFPAQTDLFGAYGIGLAAGFFGYFLALLVMVNLSRNFDVDWFLDGRRRLPNGEVNVPQVGTYPSGGNPMGRETTPSGGLSTTTQNQGGGQPMGPDTPAPGGLSS